MRYFLIDQPAAPGENILIQGSDARHIRTVLRYKPGDRIGLLDGRGVEYHAKVDRLSPKGVDLTIIKTFSSETESPVQISMAQAMLKEKKMDAIVRHLTELGISRWIPFLAARSIPRPNPKNMAARIRRWETISKEASKQCRRSRVMQIDTLKTFADALVASKMHELKILFWEAETGQKSSGLPRPTPKIKNIFLIIGPEGGFTEEEINQAREAGFVTAALGPRILRSETATMAACTLIQYRYGDMG